MRTFFNSERLLVISLSLGWAPLSSAGELPLQPDVTYDYNKPNVGIQISSLLTPDSYFDYGNQRYDSFSFSDATGSVIASPESLWLVFSDAFSVQPSLVVYQEIATGDEASFHVGWRVSTLDSLPTLVTAKLQITDATIGISQNGALLSITETVLDGQSNIIGSQTAYATSPAQNSQPIASMTFGPQSSVITSFSVQLTNSSLSGFGASVTGVEVPEPTINELIVVGLLVLRLQTPTSQMPRQNSSAI